MRPAGYSLEELRTIQDWLVKFHLQTVPGVTEVLGIGGYVKQFHVAVHPEHLLRFGVTISEVIERIRENNLNVGAQFIEKNAEEFVVRSIGLATICDIETFVMKAEDGTPVFSVTWLTFALAEPYGAACRPETGSKKSSPVWSSSSSAPTPRPSSARSRRRWRSLTASCPRE